MLLLLSFVVLCYGHKVQQKQVPHDDSTSFPLLLCPLWLLLELLCCCSATAHAAAAASVQCQSGLLFCCCFVAAADLVFVYRNPIRNRNSFYCIQNLQFVFVVVVVAVAFGSCLGCYCCCCCFDFWFQIRIFVVVFATSSHYVNFHTALHKHTTQTHIQRHTLDSHTYSRINSYVRDTNHHAYISICRRRHSPTCTLS